jgi:phenylalanyl-tRNA synthetase beta chain
VKFSLDWLSDHVDTSAAGGAEKIRALLEQAGFPLESLERAGSDTVLDVEITPNRPDVMSHRGVAREIAAMARLPFPSAREQAEGPGEGGPPAHELASVEIRVPRLCRRFGARVVRGIAAAPAPDRVRSRLASIGAKSISAAVDATNYVLWDVGQPLHAFDLDKLAGRRIVVRHARKGERLVTLDGVERILAPGDVVVADAERAVSLAGVMGGLETAVTPATRNVLLEAAWWDPAAIRRTSRRLGMHTDASHRFERGADPEAIPEALDRAAAILLAAAGGVLGTGRIDARGLPWKSRRAALRLARLRLVAGDDRLDLAFAAEALRRLGFDVEARGRAIRVGVPSRRPDVAIEDDLVEEVLRVYGYDRLPSRLPPTRGGGGHLEPLREIEERLTDAAAAAGLLETMSNPFVKRSEQETAFSAWLEATDSAPEPLSVSNGLDAGRPDLRATLLPGLVEAVARNVHRGEKTAGIFEVGRVFSRRGDPADPPSFESRRFGFAVTGTWRDHWSVSTDVRDADFFDVKALVECLLAPWIAPEELRWRPFAADALAPGASALVLTGRGDRLAVVGQISTGEAARHKISQPVFAAEIVIEAIPRDRPATRFAPYSTFPPIQADLSFSQGLDATWERIEQVVHEAGLANLESVAVADRYAGTGVPEGRVKTTIRLAFRSPDRTLSQEEVNREVQRLRAELASSIGASFD